MKRRRGLDATGKPRVEVKDPEGAYVPDVDQDTLRRIDVPDLTLVDTGRRPRPYAVGMNPYQGLKVDSGLKKRSKLDYMRALSEEIKKRRALEEARAREALESDAKKR